MIASKISPSFFCHRAAPSSVTLVVVATAIPLVVSRIGSVAARDTSTTTSMSTVAPVTGTVARHHDVAAIAREVAAVVRNTQDDDGRVGTIRTRRRDWLGRPPWHILSVE